MSMHSLIIRWYLLGICGIPVQRVYALLADEECRLSSDHWSNTNPSLLCHKQALCYRESQLPLFPHAEIVL